METLQSVADAANDACSRESLRLAWPPDELAAFLEELARTSEGFRQWNGPGVARVRR